MRSAFGTPLTPMARSMRRIHPPAPAITARMPYVRTEAMPGGNVQYTHDRPSGSVPPPIHLGRLDGPGPDGMDWGVPSGGGRRSAFGVPGGGIGLDRTVRRTGQHIEGWGSLVPDPLAHAADPTEYGAPTLSGGIYGPDGVYYYRLSSNLRSLHFAKPSQGVWWTAVDRGSSASKAIRQKLLSLPRLSKAQIRAAGLGRGGQAQVLARRARPSSANRAGRSGNRAPRTAGAPSAAAAGRVEWAQLAQQYGPAVATLLGQLNSADPRRDYHTYAAKVDNLRQMVRRAPPFAKPFLRRRLRVVEGKLRAAREGYELQREGETATRSWRKLGMTGTAVAIAAGVGVVVLLVATARTVSSHRRRA